MQSLVYEYMVTMERDVLLSDPALSRRAIHERDVSLAATLTSGRGPSLSRRVATLVGRALDSVRPAGVRTGAPQG